MILVWHSVTHTNLVDHPMRQTCRDGLWNDLPRREPADDDCSYGENMCVDFNPLLKYDGHYILIDLLEVPNLRSRAFAQSNPAACVKRREQRFLTERTT